MVRLIYLGIKIFIALLVLILIFILWFAVGLSKVDQCQMKSGITCEEYNKLHPPIIYESVFD